MLIAGNALTKKDLNALRGADDLGFSHDGDNGVSNIRTYGDGESDSHSITPKCHFYDPSVIPHNVENGEHRFNANFYVHAASHHLPIQTILTLLKEGDVLTLMWQLNTRRFPVNSKMIFVEDILCLKVERQSKMTPRGNRKIETMTFHIGSKVSDANNPIRMIKET